MRPVAQPGLGEGGVRLGGDVGPVGDHTGQVRPGLEHAGQHRAATAADVHHGLLAGEVQTGDERRHLAVGPSRHRAVELGLLVGVGVRCSHGGAPFTRS